MMTSHRVWVFGDHVNTDVIFPGKYTYTLKTPEEIASKALEDLDSTFAARVQVGDVIVAGRNWGCGSSREQAVTALKYAGVNIIIATSFNGLYYRNCINQGVWPLVCAGINEIVMTGDEITIDRNGTALQAGELIWSLPSLPPTVQAILDAGGLVPMLQRCFQDKA